MAERRSVAAPEKVDIQMTPMIDIVFQLMAFFLMTFQVATVEGDFQLKLPKSPPVIGERGPETIELRLRGDAVGHLAELSYPGDTPHGRRPSPETFRRLRAFVAGKVAAAHAAGQEEPKVRITADDALRYAHIIAAVDAVSATVDESGRHRQLAKKVSFGPRVR